MDNGATFMYHFNQALDEEERIFKLISAVLTDDTYLNITFLVNAKDYDKFLLNGDLKEKALAIARTLVPECYEVRISYKKTITEVERIKKIMMDYIYETSTVLFPKLQKCENIEINIDYATVTIRFTLPPDLYAFMETNHFRQNIKEYLEQQIMETVEVELYSDAGIKTDYTVRKKKLQSLASQPVKTISVNVKDSVLGIVAKSPKYISEVVKRESALETVCGKVTNLDMRIAKSSGKKFFLFRLDDSTGTIPVKFFPRDDKAADKFSDHVENDFTVVIEGSVQMDSYAKEMAMFLKRLCLCDIDYSTIHDEIVYKDANEDYITVFPQEYHEEIQETMFEERVIHTERLKGTYVVFDLETTGLTPTSDKIIEIGAVKMIDGVIKETFSCLINPEVPIPPDATKVNNITDEMVANAPRFADVIGDFYKFTRDSVLVAHNASFDFSFISFQAKKAFYRFDNEVLDTLQLAREKLRLPKYNLGSLCKHFGIDLENAHRALDDTIATAYVLKNLLTL